MKVLMVCNTDAALYRFRMPIIKRLKEDKCEVITVGGETGYGKSLSEIVDHHYTLNMYGQENFISTFKNCLLALNIIRKESPDVVHGFTHYGNIVAGISKIIIRSNYKLFFSVTGMGRLFVNEKPGFFENIKRNLLLNLYKIISKNADAVFVQNEDDFHLLKNYVGENKLKLQAGSGIPVNGSYERKVKTDDEKINIYMISRPVAEKGYIDYFDAVSVFNKISKEKRFVFYFAGANSLQDPWDKKVEELANAAGVNYLGYVEDVEPLLQNADIVVLPSYYREGVPRSLLEALVHDCLILTTDMPGCKTTVIDGWNGFVVKPKSPNDLCSKIMKIDHNFLNKTIRNSRKYCQVRFDAELIVSETIELYKL